MTFEIPKDKIDGFLEKLGKEKILHIKKDTRKKHPLVYKINNLLKKTADLLSIINEPLPAHPKKENFQIEEIENILSSLISVYEDVSFKEKEYKRKKESLQKLNKFLKAFNISKEQLKFKFLKFKAFYSTYENFEEIKLILSAYNILCIYEELKDYIAVISVYTPKNESKTIEILQKFSITPFDEELFEIDEKTLEKELQLINKKKETILKEKDVIKKIYSHLLYLKNIYEIKTVLKEKNGFYILEGWVPKKRYKPLPFVKNKEIDFINSPTLLNTPKFFKPFENLVKTYSLPKPYEINPTMFFAVIFIFLFGLMFGDIGQGAVLALIGYMLRNKKEILGKIMLLSGLSSMFFGAIYGHFFGFELYHFFSPMENINNLIALSIFAGAVIISTGFILYMSTNYKKRDIKKLLFGENGLLSFAIYLLLLWIGIKIFILHTDIKFDLLVLGILFIGFTGYTIYESKKTSQSLFHSIIGLLENITNTVSFVRTGAFALAHAALFLAVFTIAEMMDKTGYWITVILGNIFVIILEGVIVTIQTLRLEYYEFFKRFYEGGGYEYKPFEL
ncbi:V-type ATP synthase subunit I [Nautilia profundicola]|uniref:V-type ATP synthase subunit I n=1 Tax=Nautilia profundicola TaxID=244787 RepID=UPI00164F49F1|nr:V-type ATPase 116kDa subunit family protein [Nautilia profundicola]